MSKKILITGGHLAPAYAILKPLIKRGTKIVFVGRKHAFSDKSDLSLEYRLLHEQNKIKFYSLNSGRLTKDQFWQLPIQAILLLKSLVRSYQILNSEKPALIISFGGYLSLPVCLASFFKKIPIYLHEQTVAPGSANKILARIAKKIYITFPDTKKDFPGKKTELLGLPLRTELSELNQPPWYTAKQKPLILVLGGSSGSHSINKIIEQSLSIFKDKYQIVHQTGENKYHDYERLAKSESASYKPVKFVEPQYLAYFYGKAALIIARSGANTFFELIYFAKPAILIPLPWSAGNEQLQQAQILEQAGVAEIVDQTKPTPNLNKLIAAILAKQAAYQKNYSKLNQYAKLIIKPEQLVNKILA